MHITTDINININDLRKIFFIWHNGPVSMYNFFVGHCFKFSADLKSRISSNFRTPNHIHHSHLVQRHRFAGKKILQLNPFIIPKVRRTSIFRIFVVFVCIFALIRFQCKFSQTRNTKTFLHRHRRECPFDM